MEGQSKGKHGLKHQFIGLQLHTQQRSHDELIHPAGRTRIPRQPPLPDATRWHTHPPPSHKARSCIPGWPQNSTRDAKGWIMLNNSQAFSRSPNAAKAINVQIAACEYWTAVLPYPRHIPLDIPRMQTMPVKGRVQQLDQPISLLTRYLSGRPWPLRFFSYPQRRTTQTSFARSHRSGTRCSPSILMAFHHRTRPADTLAVPG